MSDLIKSVIKHSVVFFFTLAVFCLFMIFLLKAAMNNISQNQTDDSVPIQQDELDTWGKIPGALKYASY